MKLPDLKIGNRNRMLTKHFTNFCLVLDRDSLGLFAWLCYRADMSNKVEWGISEICSRKQSAVSRNLPWFKTLRGENGEGVMTQDLYAWQDFR